MFWFLNRESFSYNYSAKIVSYDIWKRNWILSIFQDTILHAPLYPISRLVFPTRSFAVCMWLAWMKKWLGVCGGLGTWRESLGPHWYHEEGWVWRYSKWRRVRVRPQGATEIHSTSGLSLVYLQRMLHYHTDYLPSSCAQLQSLQIRSG